MRIKTHAVLSSHDRAIQNRNRTHPRARRRELDCLKRDRPDGKRAKQLVQRNLAFFRWFKACPKAEQALLMMYDAHSYRAL